MAMDPRTPVLVGVGSITQHAGDRDPAELLEPVELMAAAALEAGADAGAPDLLERVGVIAVPKGIWSYGDPGRHVAEQIGAPTSARTVLAEVGILQQTLIDEACTAIATGQVEVALICGGEARDRAVRAARAGTEASEIGAGGVPDEVHRPVGEIITAVEIDRDLAVPAHQYALVESVLRHLDGISAEQQRDRLGSLWGGFARVAAGNPEAWDRSAPTAAQIAVASADNRMIASPYTKRLCSQWNVDQGAALLLTSVGTAEHAGVPRDRWVFPLAAAESQAMIPLPGRASLERSPGTAPAGRRLLDLTGIGLDDIAHLDIYSCFPAAVQVQARELGIALDRALTVTGGMTFAGGPLNSYVLHSTAAMAGVLRADPGSIGLVTSVSGMLTKPGLALWSTDAGAGAAGSFEVVDVTDETRATTETRPIDPAATGDGRIVAHTVVHERGVPARLVALVELDDGRRTVAVDPDPARAAESVDLDLVDRPTSVPRPGALA